MSLLCFMIGTYTSDISRHFLNSGHDQHTNKHIWSNTTISGGYSQESTTTYQSGSSSTTSTTNTTNAYSW